MVKQKKDKKRDESVEEKADDVPKVTSSRKSSMDSKDASKTPLIRLK